MGCIRNEIIPPHRYEGFDLFLPFLFQIRTHYPSDNLRSLLAGAGGLRLPCCACDAFVQNRLCKAHNSVQPGGRQAGPRAPRLTTLSPASGTCAQVGALRLGARSVETGKHLPWKPAHLPPLNREDINLPSHLLCINLAKQSSPLGNPSNQIRLPKEVWNRPNHSRWRRFGGACSQSA